MKKYFTDFADTLIADRPEINLRWSDSAISYAANRQEQWEEMIQSIARFLESNHDDFCRSEWLVYIDSKIS